MTISAHTHMVNVIRKMQTENGEYLQFRAITVCRAGYMVCRNATNALLLGRMNDEPKLIVKMYEPSALQSIEVNCGGDTWVTVWARKGSKLHLCDYAFVE